MGRRHLSRAWLLASMLAAAAPAAAASSIPFRVVAHGIATGPATAKPFALVATSRAAAHRIVLHVPPAAAERVLRTNFRTSFAIGVFGPFGCTDGRVHVGRVTQAGATVTLHLTLRPLAPGTAECQAVFETARVLEIPRVSVHGTPTKAEVTVARP